MRYLVLLAIVLIPAWGLAGESSNCTSDNLGACRIYIDKDLGPMIVTVTCEQRMREAMRLMDEMFTRAKPVHLKNGDLQLSFDIEQNKRTWTLWTQTMNDCVEGK